MWRSFSLRRSGLRAVTVAAVAVALSACGGSSYPDLDKFMAQAKARPAGHIPPVPAFTAYQAFAYGATGLRSPFQPPVEVKDITRLQKLTSVRPDPNRVKEYLEQFSFDSLRMVGTVQMNGVLWGLVQDPEGSVHRVRIGNYLGKNNGRVIQLTDNFIAVMEIVPNGPDEWVERPRKMVLAAAGGKGR